MYARFLDGASHNLTSSTVLCYRCALRNLQELAYQFRRDIPRDQLPGESKLPKRDYICGPNEHLLSSQTLNFLPLFSNLSII